MVSDRSPDFEETWGFLDRRMSDIGTLITAKKSVSEVYFLFLFCTYSKDRNISTVTV